MINFLNLLIMAQDKKLRNRLIRRIQTLSKRKLMELSELLSGIETEMNSKEKTLRLAGSWKNLDEELFHDLTIDLHKNRSKDRKIS